jgi:DNA-binding transcriptional ArsR family regulator
MKNHDLLPLSRLESAAPIIRVAAHPIRLRIIDFLQQGEACVGDISAAAETPQAITSQHLGTLRQHAILTCRRDGQRMYYRLVRLELTHLLACIRDHCRIEA